MYEENIHLFTNLKERVSFLELISSNENYFGNLQKSKLPVVLAIKGDIYYEEITHVGYHPDLQLMTATIQVKRPVGYLGGLCSDGSVEYVRFYVDYGAGWQDHGYTGIRVHDIPEGTDCQGHHELPLTYVANLKLIPQTRFCDTPVLPKLRAVLSWNSIPPANTPDHRPVWGNSYDTNIQIKPRLRLVAPDKLPTLATALSQTITHPTIPLAQLIEVDPAAKKEMADFAKTQQATELSISDLADIYNKQKKAVSPGRFGLITIKAIQGLTDLQQAQTKIKSLVALGFPWEDALKELEKTSADTSYEQLMDAGLGIAQNTLEATLLIKRRLGYSGDLCTKGSNEYVAFWADWNNDCHWHYVGTASVNVHDIPDIPEKGLSYTVVLPHDFSKVARPCQSPKVVKIRAVLSWDIPPSTNDPHALTTWGNLLDSYIQLPPAPATNTGLLFNILGGIPIDKIDLTTGLTTVNAKFALNQQPVDTGAPFAGVVVIQGSLAAGLKYRFLVTNLNVGTSYYINNPFVAVGLSGTFPYVTQTLVTPDSNSYYTTLPSTLNTDAVLARWTPGTSDKWRIDMEDATGTVVFHRNIQLHNAAPQAILSVNDGGDCRHFHKGDPVTGTFTAQDDDIHTGISYVSSYVLDSTIGPFTAPYAAAAIAGYSDIVDKPFSANSGASPTPCGKIYLSVHAKTILNSQEEDVNGYTEQIICLQP